MFLYSLNTVPGSEWTRAPDRRGCSTGVLQPTCATGPEQLALRTVQGAVMLAYPKAEVQWSNNWQLYEYGLNNATRAVAVVLPGADCELAPIPNYDHVALVAMHLPGRAVSTKDLQRATPAVHAMVRYTASTPVPDVDGVDKASVITVSASEPAHDLHTLAAALKDAMDAREQLVSHRDAMMAAWTPTTEKRVVAFSIWTKNNGGRRAYYRGAQRNVRRYHELFPGWVCRFYHDDSITAEARQMLNVTGDVEFVRMEHQHGTKGSAWRFLVASDPTVDRYIVRDADALPMVREALAVQDWIKSGKPLHLMFDHPMHAGTTWMAGMWGGTRNAVPDMEKLLSWVWRPDTTSAKGVDQYFLRLLWGKMTDRSHVLVHDSEPCKRMRYDHTNTMEVRMFPSQRLGDYDHIGVVWAKKALPDGVVYVRQTSWPFAREHDKKWPQWHCLRAATDCPPKSHHVVKQGPWIRG